MKGASALKENEISFHKFNELAAMSDTRLLKASIMSYLRQLNVPFSPSELKSELSRRLAEKVSSLLRSTCIIDPKDFYYKSECRNLDCYCNTKFKLALPADAMFQGVFLNYFSSNPIYKADFPANFSSFSACKEFRFMKKFKTNDIFTEKEIDLAMSVADDVSQPIADALKSQNLTGAAFAIINDEIADILPSFFQRYLQLSKQNPDVSALQTWVLYKNNIIPLKDAYPTFTAVQMVTIGRQSVALALFHLAGNRTTLCFLKKAKSPEKPGHAFITAFIRSCIIFKPHTNFDIIDFTNIFQDLIKNDGGKKYSFDKLNEIHGADPALFAQIAEKNLECLYQKKERYPIENILHKQQQELEMPSTIIPCIDSVSMQPLSDAARGLDCTHIACINAASFTNKCPLCNKSTTHILLDILTQKLINFVRNQNKTKTVKSVEVDNDFFKIINVVYTENLATSDDENDWFESEKRDPEPSRPPRDAETVIDIDELDDVRPRKIAEPPAVTFIAMSQEVVGSSTVVDSTSDSSISVL